MWPIRPMASYSPMGSPRAAVTCCCPPDVKYTHTFPSHPHHGQYHKLWATVPVKSLQKPLCRESLEHTMPYRNVIVIECIPLCAPYPILPSLCAGPSNASWNISFPQRNYIFDLIPFALPPCLSGEFPSSEASFISFNL